MSSWGIDFDQVNDIDLISNEFRSQDKRGKSQK